jgi:ATP-binding protein involved in chromosome partitioning
MNLDKKELDKIYSLLDKVKDPEIGVSIVKLKMLSSIEKEGDVLNITVKLTVPGCPLSTTIEKDIKEALKNEGYSDIKIEFGYMTKEELESVKNAIRSDNKNLPAPIEKYDKKSIKNIIAVYSAKGGVGKSSIVTLLALVANKKGYKIGVLDCDVSGASIQTLLNTKYRASLGKNDKLIPLNYKGIEIMSMDMLTDAEALVWRGPLVSSAIKQMYSDTDWGDIDILFLDLPPGTSDGPLTVFQSIPVDRIILITTPQNLSQTIGKKTILMANALKVPIVGIIENMSYIKCEHCGKKTYLPGPPEKIISKIPILAKLPFKKNISYEIEKTLDDETLEDLSAVINSSVFR